MDLWNCLRRREITAECGRYTEPESRFGSHFPRDAGRCAGLGCRRGPGRGMSFESVEAKGRGPSHEARANSEILSPSGKGNDTTENFRGISSCVVGPKTVPRVLSSRLHSPSLSAHGSTRPLPPRRKSEGQRYGFPRYKIKIFLLRSRGNRPPAPGRHAAPGHAERDEALLLNGAAKLGRDHPTRCALGETLRALLLLWGLLWRPIRVLERPPSAFPTLLFSPLPVRWGVAETPRRGQRRPECMSGSAVAGSLG